MKAIIGILAAVGIIGLYALMVPSPEQKVGDVIPTTADWKGGYEKAVFDSKSGNLEPGKYTVIPGGYEYMTATTSEISSTTLELVIYPPRYVVSTTIPDGYKEVKQIGTEQYYTFEKDGKEYEQPVTKTEYDAIQGKVANVPTIDPIKAKLK